VLIRDAQRQLYAGKTEDALASAERILKAQPNAGEALYVKAVCLRYLKDFDQAFIVLQDLKDREPEFGRAYQEEGHLRLAQNKKSEALALFQLACAANPALEASWRAQAGLLTEAGRKAEAAQAQAQAVRLAALPRELLAVSNYIHEGKLLRAENLCRRFLQANPHHIEAMRLLADIGTRLSALEEADFLLESALEFDPKNVQVRLDYIAVLRKRQRYDQALKHAKYLLDADPQNPVFQSHYAVECLQANDLETALVMFDTVLEKLPKDAATLTSKGHVLKTIGHQQDAIESYRAAIEASPIHGDAYHSLANLKTYGFPENEHEAMLAVEQRPYTSLTTRIQLCFALGKSFDDRGDYENAFEFYNRGNELKRHQSRYDAGQMDEEFNAQKQVCTKSLFDSFAGQGCSAPDPIFIVGLPRAGSTLLEQILASHSQVDGTHELPNIIALSHRLRNHKKVDAIDGYPNCLNGLSAGQLKEYGEKYIEDTRMHRSGAARFIDKMPNNFRHIGLIHMMLPNAKIIDARRNPMDCCFSGFKQLFAEGQEFTYGLTQIGRYYRGYVDLMDHWDRVLPGHVLRVQYEDVVSDLEGQVRRILEYCGLAFEEACLNFHQTARAVRTASSEQVRQKINTKGLEQWRPYEPWLEPLKRVLGELVEG
jgi:tetratricopeptide (TPR) repeat protein